MPIEIITALIGVVSALLGAWAGSAISRKSANDIMRKQEFNKAASALRSAFAPTISFVYIAEHHGNHDRPNIDKQIKDSIFSHGGAVEEFRPFVSNSERSNYQKAWEEYRQSAIIDQYALSAEAKIEGITSEEYLKKRIQNILQYAELK